ncbi:hypothetical protein ZBT109_0358 [Zymobacter palmae]|uniref:Uncharacterized protein n=1 Tax=Zymobacter palmae TaxID=33074 RepID=A0A348HBZ5_9GAMM|nr:hypothetical protein ZBT109_0358 [Zymobacter palmae]
MRQALGSNSIMSGYNACIWQIALTGNTPEWMAHL